MESDETIVEEVLDALKMTLEDRRVYGRRYATCSLTQSAANLEQRREQERLVKAGAIPVLVQTLTQREEDWEGVVLGRHRPLEPRVRREIERRSSLSRGRLTRWRGSTRWFRHETQGEGRAVDDRGSVGGGDGENGVRGRDRETRERGDGGER